MFITWYCGLLYVKAYSYFSSAAKCKFELEKFFDLVKNRQMKILQQKNHLSSHSLYNALLVSLKVVLSVSVRKHILCRGRLKKEKVLWKFYDTLAILSIAVEVCFVRIFVCLIWFFWWPMICAISYSLNTLRKG